MERIFEDQILSNKLLQNQIVKSLDHSDILTCALVSESWQRIFRRISQDHEHVLKLENLKSLSELEHITEIMENMTFPTIHPFHSLKIVFSWAHGQILNGEIYWEQIYKIRLLLQRICSAVNVTRAIFDFRGVREEIVSRYMRMLRAYQAFLTALPVHNLISLRLLHMQMDVGDYRKVFKPLRGKKFPMLKSIYITPGQDLIKEKTTAQALKEILSVCPALEELSVRIYPTQIPYFIKSNKLPLLKMLILTDVPPLTFEKVDYLAGIGLELKTIIISPNLPVSPAALARIIHSSAESLTEVKLDQKCFEDIIAHSNNGKFPLTLVNVRDIEIEKDWAWRDDGGDKEREVRSKYEKMDSQIRRVFPNFRLITFMSIE